jgi:[histone H3]-lysine4 N-trimethyltransferase SETD1
MSSGGGGVEAVRSASPGTLKRKRELSHSRSSPGAPPKNTKYGNGTFTSSRLSNSTSADVRDAAQHYRSPDSDEMHQSDSGEALRGIGSASSLASTASSVFSASNAHAYAQNRKASLANGLTPLTSHSDSSPPKLTSPPNSRSAADMAANPADGASATAHMPSSDTTHKERPRMLPPPGKAKGYRVVWDPELDGKLSREERKRATLRKRDFGTEVRCTFHNLLSLRNMSGIT